MTGPFLRRVLRVLVPAMLLLAVAVTVVVLCSKPAHAEDGPGGCPAVIVETFGYLAYDACYVAYVESKWQANAISSTGDYGLFQINKATWGSRATLDPRANAQFAYELSKGGTEWCPHWRWTCP